MDRNKRFELRLTEQEHVALRRLAKKNGTNRSDLVAGMIRRAAQRKKVWT